MTENTRHQNQNPKFHATTQQNKRKKDVLAGEKYSIAADSSEDVKVARIDEVEGDGINGTLALLKTVGNSVLSLLRRRQ